MGSSVSTGRLNSVIGKLLDEQIVVCSPPVPNGSLDAAQRFGDSGFDMVWFEMEHVGFDFPSLRASLQSMLSRRQIAADGLAPSAVPFARIPPGGRETSEWIIKQTLDAGVYGLLIPQLETPEEALRIVEAARYPARLGSELGGGRRGVYPHVASRYWGVSDDEYLDRADLWPVNPDGELLLIGIVESVAGVDNIERILDATQGFGAFWPGPGDLCADMGLRGQPTHPAVEEKMQKVLDVCSERGVPCVGAATNRSDAVRRVEQGFQMIVTWPEPGIAEALRATSRKDSHA